MNDFYETEKAKTLTAALDGDDQNRPYPDPAVEAFLTPDPADPPFDWTPFVLAGVSGLVIGIILGWGVYWPLLNGGF